LAFSQTVRILCVDRNPALARRIAGLFTDRDVAVMYEKFVGRVLQWFEKVDFQVLVFNGAAMAGDDGDGLEILEVLSAECPGTQVLFLVESDNLELAMSALRAGSYQYAKLPISDEELLLLITSALERRPDYSPNMLLKSDNQKMGFEDLVGRSPEMMAVFRHMRQAAATDIPVLLDGETGTGKDVAAWSIHSLSSRKTGPYIPVNLGALPRELVANELFGHEKGAFTGALTRHPGTFEQAHQGTVFLDEVTSLDERMQISLLRLLETRSFQRIGGESPVEVDVRIIAATNENLYDAVEQGSFREDLLYRLDVFRIQIPPLAQRRGDTPQLIDHFLKSFNQDFNKNIRGISTECMAMLEAYRWPGNVRELRNVIQRAVVLCDQDVLLPEHMPERIKVKKPGRDRLVTLKVGTTLAEMEREMIVRTLIHTRKNRQKAAALLGISRRALYNKIARHNIPLDNLHAR